MDEKMWLWEKITGCKLDFKDNKLTENVSLTNNIKGEIEIYGHELKVNQVKHAYLFFSIQVQLLNSGREVRESAELNLTRAVAFPAGGSKRIARDLRYFSV